MISVIVPVYNVEPYLRKCLDSIVNQTYRDLEILVIDDGSTDGSGKICDEYAEYDERIRVFHTVNRGLSAARNLGLDNVTGDWIGFVDSDDWIDPDMYELLLKRALETGADVVECGYFKEYSNMTIKTIHTKAKRTGKAAVQALLNGEQSTDVWSKLWNKTCFESIRYTEGRVFEDVAITYRLFLISNYDVYIDETKYHWLQRKNSLSKSHDYLCLVGFWLSHKERYETLKELMGEDTAREQLRFCASAASRAWAYFYDQSAEERDVFDEFIREINSFSKEFFPLLGDKTWGVTLRIGTFFTHFHTPLSLRIAWTINSLIRNKDELN